MLVDVHDEDRRHQTQEISDECGVEVQAGLAFQAAVEAEQQRDENAGDDDVAESQHGEIRGVQSVGEQILREHQLDGRFKTLRHGDHHVGAEHPEDVVDEEPAEQDASGDDVVEMEQLHTVDGERQAEQVVGDPVLLEQVPDADYRRQHEAHDVVRRELVVDQIFVAAFRELYVERHVRYRGRHEFADHRRHQMVQGQHAQHEEVAGEEQVDVLLGEDFEEDVKTEQRARSNDLRI